MAADDAGERTEQPTPRRRQEAREKGQVPRSTDLTAAITLLAGLLLLNWLGPDMFGKMLELTREIGRIEDPTTRGMTIWLARAGSAAGAMTAPLLILLVVFTVGGSLLQTGASMSLKLLAPKLDKVDPIKGVQRLFSTDSLRRAGMGVLKLAAVAAVAWFSLVDQIQPVLGSATLGPLGILHVAGNVTFTLGLRLALVLLILGLVDYFLQRAKLEKSLKMTKQEVRDEMKRMEGDPQLRQHRRQVQARLALQRLGIDVPKADVVVTNPTEYAVALRYDEATMSAPRVIAKGKQLLALRIRQIAEQHGIPIVERPPLARALYAGVEVGQEVPPQFYRAVAELLAYVYQLSNRAAVRA